MNLRCALAGILALLAIPAHAADLSAPTWNEIDGSNNSAPPAGWPAGMAPNQVSPTARAMMGATKRFYDHINATVTSGGTANAQTLTYPVAPAAYALGDRYLFTAGTSNAGATTLNVNGLGPISVRLNGGVLVGGEFKAGKLVEVVYDGTQFELGWAATKRLVCNLDYSDPAHTVPGYCFIAASIGTEPGDGIMGGISGSFLTGLDLSGGTYTSGRAIVVPNNTQVVWKNAAGTGFVGGISVDATDSLVIGINGTATHFSGPFMPKATTVAALPVCNAGAEGNVFMVSDAVSPTYNASLVGGGVSRSAGAVQQQHMESPLTG